MQPPLSGAPVTLAPSDTSPPPRVPVHPSPSPAVYTPPAPLPVLSFCPPNHRDESNNSSSNGGRGHGRLSRAPRPAGAIDESSCSTLHGRTRCPLWLRRPPWAPRRWLRPRRHRTGCAAAAAAGRGRGRTSCTTRRRRRRRRRRRCKGGGLAVRATGCSCWRRWRKRRRGRPRRKTSGPPLAPSPRGTRRKGRRWRAPGRRRGRGGPRRPAGSRACTPSTTPSPSSNYPASPPFPELSSPLTTLPILARTIGEFLVRSVG
uniref:Uncharacterized protein n=1 Tax=Aegilops tauschii subsp. strangulata TaxID=200361 RepID=A0A453SQJ3_AEGTS